EPFVFDAEGNFVSSSKREKEDERAAYVDQLQYVNREAMALVDALLSGPASSRPVVILQADEGPFSGLGPSSSTRVSLDRLREKFGILNAYYHPGVARRGLSSGITPVNSCRVVFDVYFGAGLPLLPGR